MRRGLCAIVIMLSLGKSGWAEPPRAPAFPCGPERHLHTAEELLATLTTEWARPGVGISPMTVDLIADVDLVVKSDRLPLPTYCTSRCTHEPGRVHCTGTGDPCRTPVRFRVNDPVRGVKVDGDSEAREGIHLQVKAGTHFRLRQRVLEYHPKMPYYDPIITVEPSCQVACHGGELRCPDTGQCVPDAGDSYCLNCTGLSRPECACRNREGVLKPDKQHCSFRAGDYFPTGHCQAGRCVTAH